MFSLKQKVPPLLCEGVCCCQELTLVLLIELMLIRGWMSSIASARVCKEQLRLIIGLIDSNVHASQICDSQKLSPTGP